MFTDSLGIVPKGMELVGQKAHWDGLLFRPHILGRLCCCLLAFGSLCWSYICWSLALGCLLLKVCSSASSLGSSLHWKFLNNKIFSDFACKPTKLFSQGFCQFLNWFECVFCMEAKLCICMPSFKEEESVKDNLFMVFVLFWGESFKDRDDTLLNQLWVAAKLTTAWTHTCKMSSKSHAASCFKPETSLVNFLIVSRPNVGTIRKLEYATMRGMPIKLNTRNLLMIKFSNSCRTTGKQKPNEMDEKVLEDTQLKLMH